MTTETIDRERILMEAHCIELEDAYFGARPQIDCSDRRKVFQAGFERAWQRLAELGVSVPAETGRIEPVAWMHIMHMEDSQTTTRVTLSQINPFGLSGINYSAEYVVEMKPLYLSPPLPTKEGWQPIETAPKDGTHMLLSDGGRVSFGGWAPDLDQGAEYEGQIGMAGWWAVDLGPNNDRPTSWMPLPAAPKP